MVLTVNSIITLTEIHALVSRRGPAALGQRAAWAVRAVPQASVALTAA